MSENKTNSSIEFEEDPPGQNSSGHIIDSSDQLLLNIDGFEGPIDVLLEMAKKQKVDLKQISVLQLVRQYIAFIDRARTLRLDLAAEYLVMAAWLAYLKSRLLIPSEQEDIESSGEDMAEALAFQLQRLKAMQEAGEKLSQRPLLYKDVAPRGQPEGLSVRIQKSWNAGLYDLLKAYSGIRKRNDLQTYQPAEFNLVSTDQALEWLQNLLGHLPAKGINSVWATLESFVKQEPVYKDNKRDPLMMRSGMASTLLAGLEMAKQGRVEMHQDGLYRPIYIRELRGCELTNKVDKTGT